jgi:glycosyltransferase involved in cell wall biosynthesis
MLQLIELFQQQGWKVTFASVAADSQFAVDLKSLNVDKVTLELNSSIFDTFIQSLNPGIVMFDRFMTEEQFGWRVAENCPEAVRILDTEDLHCLRSARQLAWKEKRTFSKADLFCDVAKREVASIYRCDLSLIISQYEMTLLNDVFKLDPSLAHYLPFMLDPADTSDWLVFSEKKNFVTIGNFLHDPNLNSVHFLKEEIWPLIRQKMPGAQLYVYGAYPSQKVTQLHKASEGFNVMGRADDAKKVISEAKVLLAPLRYGAGLKGKLIDAMMFGTPNVTTSVGAEAMHGEMEWSGLVADDAESFADAAVSLYSDENLWKQKQENGKKIINTLFQKEEAGNRLIDKIIQLQADLQNHRRNNFTGAMLMHHTISGTKYMSKWIEEKNKES